MSHECSRCKKQFKYNYLLVKHQKKKSLCKEYVAPIGKIETQVRQLETSIEEANQKIDEITKKLNNTGDNSIIRCQYCNKIFSFGTNYTRHLRNGRCKMKYDNVAIYERELSVVPEEVEINQCRFCKVQCSTKSSYSRHMTTECKEKIRYEHELEKRVLQNRREVSEAKVVNNNTININLPQMRAFGDENLDYITTKCLIKALENCHNYQDMSTTVSKFTKLIHANPAHPENQNVLIKNLNSGFARVFNGSSFEDRHSVEVQDRILQNIGTFVQKKCDE